MNRNVLMTMLVVCGLGAAAWSATALTGRGVQADRRVGPNATQTAAANDFPTATGPSIAKLADNETSPTESTNDGATGGSGAPRFTTVALWLDSGGAALAAYQLEFAASRGQVKIVGIEGGQTPVFADPPYYDPRAMQHDRAILAAFSTAEPARLPTGRTRIATIHLMIEGPVEPRYEARLVVAADTQGQAIQATVTCESAGTP